MIPGQLKMYSTSTAPANIEPTWSPTMDVTGRSAFRRTCRHATIRSPSPFARAVRTKSRLASSRKLDRVMRITVARGAAASAITGRARWRRKAARSSAGGTYPVGGSQRSRSENTNTSSMPTTNTGIENPASATEEAAGSASRPRRRAGEHSEGHPEPDRQDGRRDDELEGARQAVREVAGDRALVDQRGAEIAPQDPAEPGAVLDQERAVEPEAGTDPEDLLG